MNWTAILYAALALGGLGIVFGVVLTIADKKFAVQVDDRIGRVREYLAGANCGACGYPGCDGFADAVVSGKAPVNGCAPAGADAAKAIAEIMGTQAQESAPSVARVLCQGEVGVARDRYEYDGYKSCLMASGMAGGPKKCPYACVGLGDCVDVCVFGALSIRDGLVHVDEERCTACGACVKACPRHVISVLPREASVVVRCRNSDTGRVAREACMKGCIACKRCEKECKYDAIHVTDGFAKIDVEKCTRCGDCVKVCPCSCIDDMTKERV